MEQQILGEYSIVFLLFLLIIGFSVFRVVKSYIYKHKMKKLKYEGTGVLKKTKVLAVRERYVSGGEDSSGYYLYRLESEDETSNIYVSESFKDAKHGGRSLEEMRVKYDGVIYDLGNRDEAIRQINDNIHRLEMELQNDPGFFKKRELKKDIESMKKYIDIANEGPITPYLIINSHKISEGDSIDVYVNPDKPEQYYFDLDFTKEK